MQISAYVDGELSDSEAGMLLRRMSQDAGLRREAAEFLELGRIMRGEGSAPGIERLRERIAAGIDGRPEDDSEVSPDTQKGSALRPLVGVAVAASVALIALFGLQLTPGVDSATALDEAVVEAADDAGYTVPERIDGQLRQYYLSHGASSGANSVNARLVTLRLSEELLVEEEDQDAAADETTADEPTQP
ncbi:MAG: hypothetical protein HKO69_01360 [Woeseiaceae bacterium]|nr:hypothetical protein [Gammaproteobacteria bacterium]NNF48900.1 hypothetical protein [Woeseiaceae bacterium]NNK24707.1 hypothetical protein [Woeseiaceae bacterium]NNL62434.1 hypothetical protein [Woeseiaceae bacterium]